MLTHLGVDHAVVSGGREALEAIVEEAFSPVLMDCQMPGLDGLETTRRVRAREVALPQALPIVALTANVTAEDRAACLASGMDDFPSKPVTLGRLGEVLRRYGVLDGADDTRPDPASRARPKA